MIDHIGLRVADLDVARRFYEASLAPLGMAQVMEVTAEETGGYHGVGYGVAGRPFFWIGNRHPASAGLHIAFSATSRDDVDAFYKAALMAGGGDNGPPGIRAHYHPNYYAAFVLDPDGHNVEAVCHTPA